MKTQSRLLGAVMFVIALLIILLWGCCPKPPIVVYFQEPKYKIEVSKSHKHGRMLSPHYIPIREHILSYHLVGHYEILYRKKVHETKKSESKDGFLWVTIPVVLFLSSSSLSCFNAKFSIN